MSRPNALKNGELFPSWLHMQREDFERWVKTLKVVNAREHFILDRYSTKGEATDDDDNQA